MSVNGEKIGGEKRGIGGSDAGAVCGLNPYVSAMDVYYDKRSGTVDSEERDNESMRLGRDLEDYVAKRFCEDTGFKVIRSHKLYQHEEYPFMQSIENALLIVDRLLVGHGEDGIIGLECKTASPFSMDKWKEGNIPAHYLAQCHHYMAVLGAKAWYIAVIIYGREFKWIRIERDEDIIRDLVRIEKDFREGMSWQGRSLSRTGARRQGTSSTVTLRTVRKQLPYFWKLTRRKS